MREQLQRWRSIVTLEAVLALLVTAVAVGVGYQYRQMSGLESERDGLQEELARVESDLQAYREEHNVAALREQARELENNPANPGLPSREEALRVGTDLSGEAATHGVEVVAFAATDITLSESGEKTAPAMELSLTGRGSMEELVGIVGVVDVAPAARIQKVALSREEEMDTGWLMELAVEIPYR